MSNKYSATLRAILFTAIIAILLIAGVTQYRQWVQYCRGKDAEAAKNPIIAIAGYESAIHMYTPGSPIVERAAQALWNMGLSFEAQKDTERALIAFRALRSSFYASRSFFLPGQKWIGRCNEKIIAIEQAVKAQSAAPKAKP